MASTPDAVPSATGCSDRVVLGAWVRYGVGMATRNQRQEAQKRARKKQEEDRKKLEHELRLKRKATEDAWVAIMDVDRVKYAAGQALGVLLEFGQSREDLMEEFDLSRADLNAFLKAEPVDSNEDDDEAANGSESSVSDDEESATGNEISESHHDY